MATPPTRAYYIGDGIKTNYTFPFDYLQNAFVKVYVGAVEVPFTFLNDHAVTITPAPAVGAYIEIVRETSRDRIVDYVDGSVLLARDLDFADIQLLHIAQETYERTGISLELLPDNSYGASGRRLSDLAAPTLPHDAATKEYVDTVGVSVATAAGVAAASPYATAAAASAAAAATSATNAATSRTNAQSSATAAAASAAAATAAKDSMVLRALTPEDFGAVGDGVADDSAAIVNWMKAVGGVKTAPSTAVYRWGTPRSITSSHTLGIVTGDLNGAKILLRHNTALSGDTETAALRISNQTLVRMDNFVVDGAGSFDNTSWLYLSRSVVTFECHNMDLREIKKRALWCRADNVVITGTLNIYDCQTFDWDGTDPAYDQGAVRINDAKAVYLERAEITSVSSINKRALGIGECQNVTIGLIHSPYYAPGPQNALFESGQVFYLNYCNNVFIGGIFIENFYATQGSMAVYFSRDCTNVTVGNAVITATGGNRSCALVVGGGKNHQIHGTFKAKGQVIRIEGHRDGYTVENVHLSGKFICAPDAGQSIDNPPIQFRSNVLAPPTGRPDLVAEQVLKTASFKGEIVLEGANGSFSGTGGVGIDSDKGCLIMVSSCSEHVDIGPVFIDLQHRSDVTAIGVGGAGGETAPGTGTTRSTGRVTIRDSFIKTSDRWCVAALDGNILFQNNRIVPNTTGQSLVYTPTPKAGTSPRITILNNMISGSAVNISNISGASRSHFNVVASINQNVGVQSNNIILA